MTASWSTLPIADFDSVAETWGTLNRETIGQAVLTPEFVRSLKRHFLEESDVVAVHRDGQRVNAMGVLRPTGAFRWATAQPSQAPLGLWLSRPGALTNEMLGSLSRALPGRVLMVDLLQLDSAAHRDADEGDRFIRRSPYITTSKLPVPEDFDAYFAGLGKNLRQSYRKSVNRLAKNGVTTKLSILTSPESMAQAVIAYGELESSGWKAKLGTAVKADNVQGRFYADLMETLAHEEMAEVWEYRFDDRIVAMDLCIKQAGIMTILKTAFDENESRYSPSIMMKLEAARELATRGDIREIEFFGRMIEWHRRLNSIPREMFHLSWCRYPILFSLNELRKKTMSRIRLPSRSLTHEPA